MHILLTNDDGFKSPGFKAAYQALTQGGHKVTAVAPDQERSGQSHSITFYSYLYVKNFHLPDGTVGYSVSGTPADCAHIGCCCLTQEPVHMVISGINTDTNLGYDANYSGTVAAALEAASMGYPSLAVSLERSDNPDWEKAGQVTLEAANCYSSWGIPVGALVNINIPAIVSNPEWAWVPLNLIAVNEWYEIDTDEDGHKRYKRTRQEEKSACQPGSDVEFIRQGRITLSPLGPVRTVSQTLARLQNQALGASEWPTVQAPKRAQKPL